MAGGMYLDLEDIDQVRHQLSCVPVYVDELDVTEFDSRAQLNDMLLTRYDSDKLDGVPSCECGTSGIRGGWQSSTVCHVCHSPVRSHSDKEIESRLWIRPPVGVKAMINPQVLDSMIRFFKVGGEPIVQWLLDPYYKPKNQIAAFDKIRHSGIERGINYFVDNFEFVFDYLLTNIGINKTKKERQKFRVWIMRNRHKLFPEALPIPAKITFIVENTPTGGYADGSIDNALDAVRTITSLKSGISEPSWPTKLSKTFRACLQLSNFYDNFYRKSLSKKAGWFRRHIFGSRPAFSFRAVISSLSENHRYDETHLPWSLSVSLLNEHLRAALRRMGYTPREAAKHIDDHIETYCPILDGIIKDLIAQCDNGGFPVIIQRNPSLKRASAQRFFVTKVKTDPKIKTISMSVLVLKGPNADQLAPQVFISLQRSNGWSTTSTLDFSKYQTIPDITQLKMAA